MHRLSARAAAIFRARDGATALETGLVIGLFCMLMLGAIEVGRYFFTYEQLRTIVAEAARQAQINTALSGCQTGGGINNAVRQRTPFNVTGLTVCYTRSVANNVTTVAINASMNFTFLVPFFGSGTRSLNERTQTVY